MKKIIILLLLFPTLYSWSQNDRGCSVDGVFVRSINYNLSNLKTSNGYSLDQVIRKIEDKNEKASFYYNISDYTAVEYSELLKIIEAVNSLKEDVAKDIALKPDYLDNKYTTSDGFCVGYYIRMDKIKKTWFATWFLFFDKRNSDRTLQFKDDMTIISLTEVPRNPYIMFPFKDVAVLEAAFHEAKAKIEELRK